MGNKDNKITLYSSQSKAVVEIIESEGACFSRREYVAKKYEESSGIFLAAYDWFSSELPKYVEKPQGAEYPYWAFKSPDSIDTSGENKILSLSVPVEEVVFFDMYDWNKILRLQYIGDSDQEEREFRKRLADYGISRESDVVLTNFYPELKAQVQSSWQRLFIYNEKIKEGSFHGVESVQAALWQIKKDWIDK